MKKTNLEFGFLEALGLVVSGAVHRRRVDGAAGLDDHRRLRLGLAQGVAGHDGISAGVFRAHVQNIQGDVSEIVEQVNPAGLSIQLEMNSALPFSTQNNWNVPA